MSDEEGETPEEPEEPADFEYHSYFVGCTCDHEPEQHEWGGGCKVEGCPCEGGWEE